MDPETEISYRAKLREAVMAGHKLLGQGGSSLDAVTEAVRILEDSPLFNAGRGAVFNHQGINELDAAIMDGSNLAAGAVTGLRHIRNPVVLARKIMECSRHVMLSGEGAEEFAREQGMEMEDQGYFHTQRRWHELQQAQLARESGLEPKIFGTVGAVALDSHGNLAAATSTGGMTDKQYGRIGDSPIIGAGTYADNNGCAVSATGHGEYFIRAAVAHDLCARMIYGGRSLGQAAKELIRQKLVGMGAEGGIIAVSSKGEIAMEFNSQGMYRAAARCNDPVIVGIFGNET
jgi:beta-aspartyl-peptidase (threonine type)